MRAQRRELALAHRRHVVPGHPHDAGGRPLQRAHDVQQRRLARAGRADDRGQLARARRRARRRGARPPGPDRSSSRRRARAPRSSGRHHRVALPQVALDLDAVVGVEPGLDRRRSGPSPASSTANPPPWRASSALTGTVSTSLAPLHLEADVDRRLVEARAARALAAQRDRHGDRRVAALLGRGLGDLADVGHPPARRRARSGSSTVTASPARASPWLVASRSTAISRRVEEIRPICRPGPHLLADRRARRADPRRAARGTGPGRGSASRSRPARAPPGSARRRPSWPSPTRRRRSSRRRGRRPARAGCARAGGRRRRPPSPGAKSRHAGRAP